MLLLIGALGVISAGFAVAAAGRYRSVLHGLATVDRWIRYALLAMLLWALTTYGVGTLGVPIFTLLYVVISASLFFFMVIMIGRPIVGAAAFLPVPQIQGAARWIATLFALEMLMGVYYVLVPVGFNNTTRYFGAVAMLLMVVAIVLRLAVEETWVTWVKVALWGIAAILTAAIFLISLTPKEVEVASAYRQRELDWKAGQKVLDGEGTFGTVLGRYFKLWFGEPKPEPPKAKPKEVKEKTTAAPEPTPAPAKTPKKNYAPRTESRPVAAREERSEAIPVKTESPKKEDIRSLPTIQEAVADGSFRVELKKVERIGTDLVCWFTITNMDEAVRPFYLSDWGRVGVLYDELGNEICSTRGNVRSSGPIERANLNPGTPTLMKVLFGGVSTEMKRIERLIVYGADDASRARRNPAQFVGIELG